MTAYALPAPDPTSVVGRRILAWTLDLLSYIALTFGVLFATGGMDIETRQFASSVQATAFCDGFQDTGGQRFCSVADDEVLIIEVDGTTNGVWIAYTVGYCLLQGLTGGSPGKLALGLRVVDGQGRQVTIGKSFLRTLLWIVDALTCGIPIIGGVAMVSSKGHRRVGDMAAGTYVVAKAHVGHPVEPIGGQPAVAPWGAPAQGGTWAPPAGAPLSAPTSDGPIWDDARDTYIQYDRSREAWVQWDTATSEWRPIDQ